MGINLSSLINIFMQMEPERTYFFNKKTGNVLSISTVNMSKQDMTTLAEIKKDAKQEDMPTENEILNLSVDIPYVQA